MQEGGRSTGPLFSETNSVSLFSLAFQTERMGFRLASHSTVRCAASAFLPACYYRYMFNLGDQELLATGSFTS
jgi:hypothetical protein